MFSFCLHIKIKQTKAELSYDTGIGDKTPKSSLSYENDTDSKYHITIVYFGGYSCLLKRNMQMLEPGAFESVPTSWRLWALENGEMSGKVHLGKKDMVLERIKVTFPLLLRNYES